MASRGLGWVGGEAYAAGSWRKLKSLVGMSVMPRDGLVSFWGERGRDERAGERMRVGREDEGESVVCVDAERGLCCVLA